MQLLKAVLAQIALLTEQILLYGVENSLPALRKGHCLCGAVQIQSVLKVILVLRIRGFYGAVG